MTDPFDILAAEYRPMVLAYLRATREPRTPGSQGHEVIPKKGQNATFYLTGGGKEPFEPITPNGMVPYSVVVD